jgi:hypothetical protein
MSKVKRNAYIAGLALPLLHPETLDLESPWWKGRWSSVTWKDFATPWISKRLEDTTDAEGIYQWCWGNRLEPPTAVEAICEIASKHLRISSSGELASKEVQATPTTVSPEITGDVHTFWVYLTRIIPPDVICAAAWHNEGGEDGCPENISYTPQEVKGLFSEYMGDYHVHWGAALKYTDILPRVHSLREASRVLIQGYEDEAEWRELEGGYAWHPMAAALLHGLLSDLVARFLTRNEPNSLVSLRGAQACYKELSSLALKRPGMRELEGRYAQSKIGAIVTRLGEQFDNDAPTDLACDVGVDFLLSALKSHHEESNSRCRDRFKAYDYLLGMTLRWRCLLFGYMTMSGLQRGHSVFREHYRQMRSLEHRFGEDTSIERRLYCLSRDGKEPLDRIEFRTDACEKTAYIEKLLQQFGEWQNWTHDRPTSSAVGPMQNSGQCSERSGSQMVSVCFSFGLRKPDHSSKEFTDDLANNLVRFDRLTNDYRQTVDTFMNYCKRNHEILHLVRGLDVYNDETSLPNWVPGLVYSYLRKRMPKAPPYVRNTFHAGESFRSPSAGLRAISECVHVGGGVLDENDRIGHGLALGFQHEPSYTNSIGNWIDDLVWEWGLWQEMSGTGYQEQRAVEREIGTVRGLLEDGLRQCGDLACQGAAVTLQAGLPELSAAYRLRFDFDKLENLGLVSSKEGRVWFDYRACRQLSCLKLDRYRILYEYLCNKDLRQAEKFDHSMPFDDDKKRRLDLIREHVIGQCRRTGIAVEVCPTSNLITLNLETFSSHPVFVLSPPGGVSQVEAVVCTDDPAVFNCTIRDEYRNLFIGAVADEIGRQEAATWLRQLHDTGKRRSFCIGQDTTKIRDLYNRVSNSRSA